MLWSGRNRYVYIYIYIYMYIHIYIYMYMHNRLDSFRFRTLRKLICSVQFVSASGSGRFRNKTVRFSSAGSVRFLISSSCMIWYAVICRVVSCRVVSCRVMSCHFMACILCYGLVCYIMVCCIILYSPYQSLSRCVIYYIIVCYSRSYYYTILKYCIL